MRLNFKHTIAACYVAYIVGAIIANFLPLLFVTLSGEYNLSITKITLLVTLNFAVQLTVDLIGAKFCARIGYRASIVGAHLFAAVGLVFLAVLPSVMSDPMIGLILAVVCYAVGGGILEVLVSPIVEACPTERKASEMSLLHSFYCWGYVAVVAISTVFFVVFGLRNWRILALIWAAVPLLNAVYLMFVPIERLPGDEAEKGGFGKLMTNRYFWICCLLMFAAGASELSMSQWASAFAESGLGVSKTLGDLLGPCLFAALMGSARGLYAKFDRHLKLPRILLISGVLCMACYLTAALIPQPVVALIGCALTGFSVGVLWPGTFSLGAEKIPRGGTMMFGLFALAGDLGCTAGPSIVGWIAGGSDLQTGLAAASVFPVLIVVGVLLYLNRIRKDERSLIK